MLNKWKDIPLWVKIIIIIPLFIFPLAVHLLFIIPAISKYCEARWSAGELLGFCGGYLAFLGPTMLSFVALYQNEQYKNDSDKAQRRMEEISVQSNEYNLINTILDFQMSRYNKVFLALDRYKNATAAVHFLDIFVPKEPPLSVEEKNLKVIKRYYELCEECNELFREIVIVMKNDKRTNSNKNELIQKGKALKDHLSSLQKEDLRKYLSSTDDSGFLNSLTQHRADYIREMDLYLAKLESDIAHAMYTPMTLEEVRKLFNPPKKENTNNGKNENGIPESDRSEC